MKIAAWRGRRATVLAPRAPTDMDNPEWKFAQRNLPALLASFFLAYALVLIATVPYGQPPDERAHLGYIADVVEPGSLWPNYENGRVLRSTELNYLIHPPLYYSLQGLVGRLFKLDAYTNYKSFRVVNAVLFTVALWLILIAARRLGIGPFGLVALGLGALSVPWMPYIAASVNNDALAYFGVGLTILGLVTQRPSTVDAEVPNLWWVFLGLAIAFLTKLTAAAFLCFLLLAYALVRWRDFLKILPTATFFRPFFVFLALVIPVYMWMRVSYGSFSPAPRYLYTFVEGIDPMPTVDFVRYFVETLWHRSAVVMSHLSVAPLTDWGRYAFRLLIVVPPFLWLLLRIFRFRRLQGSHAIQIGDAIMAAAAATLLLHGLYTFRGYLGTGLLTGMQPRYHMQVIPLIWIPFLTVVWPGARSVFLSLTFLVLVTTVFLGSVPFFQKAQHEVMIAHRAPQAFIEDGVGIESVELVIRRQVKHAVDHVIPQSDSVYIKGWVFDTETQESPIRVLITNQGRVIGSAPVDNLRVDVAAVLGSRKARHSGFSSTIYGVDVGDAGCSVQLFAEFSDGGFVPLHNATCEIEK